MKTDFFNTIPEKENERVIAVIESLHHVFKQFLRDSKKYFYYMTTNFVVSFVHISISGKEEYQTIALLSGKNKNLCRLLEKESYFL